MLEKLESKSFLVEKGRKGIYMYVYIHISKMNK